MRFCPNEPPDHYKGQRLAWNLLKLAFEGDEGIAYYRYPVFSGRGSERREPDFLVVSRKFGIWVFECKGAHLENIREIQGQEWVMQRWYNERMSPIQQAEDQMFEIKNLVERRRELRGLGLVFDYRVVLPFIKASAWEAAGFAQNPSARGVVLTGDQLARKALRQEIKTHGLAYMPDLSDEQWETLKGVFRGEVTDREPRSLPDRTPAESPLHLIHAVETRLRLLDEAQERVANEAPEGPQRIRGLAGTGKTVLLAKRAARMHAAHPDWDIAFIFYTRSLYQQVRGLIARSFKELTGEAPNYDKLRIWHAWGGKDLTGFYREAALAWEQRPLNLGDAQKAVGYSNAATQGFDWACRQLESALGDTVCEPFLDAILIDEGQDLPMACYRLAAKALRPPRRLYWAYDEAQGIGNLIVPRAADVFGVDPAGKPKVDLSGTYTSGIQKAHNLNRCYRTPARVLMAAHAVNMGLLRPQGPLQAVTHKDEWRNLGYRVTGDFSQASVAAGRDVVLERDPEACGHPLDDKAFYRTGTRGDALRVAEVAHSDAALKGIVEGIRDDLAAGLEPHDLLVVTLPQSKPSAERIRDALIETGIDAFVTGDAGDRETFRRTGYVTVSGVYRAKGNEAWKVYASGLHQVTMPAADDPDAELIRRNQAFVALSRARLWCVAMGEPGPIMTELQQFQDGGSQLTFKAFNQRSLHREVTHGEPLQQSLF